MKRETIRAFIRKAIRDVIPYALLTYGIAMLIALWIVAAVTRGEGTLPPGVAVALGAASGIASPLVRRYVERLRDRVHAAGGQWPSWPGWRAAAAAAASGLLQIFLSNFVAIAGAAVIYTWGKTAPVPASLPEPAATIYGVVWQCGWIWLMIWTIYRLFRTFVFGEKSPLPLLQLVRDVLARMVMLVLASVAICKFSPTLVTLMREIEANPHTSLATAIGLLIIYGAFRVVDSWIDVPSQQYVVARAAALDAGASMSAYKRWPRTASEIRRTAVHEAGHALLYAALPKLPENFVVKVFGDLSAIDRYRGYVRGEIDSLVAQIESASRWVMLVKLAGTVAEKVVYGERADGATEDNAQWTRAAQRYLAAGYGEVYFDEPATDHEAECNQRALNRLKIEHYGVIEAFLCANRPLLEELAEQLVAAEELDQQAIASYFARVIYTPEFQPLPGESLG